MEKKLDKLLISVSLIFVLSIVALLYLFPTESESMANQIFTTLTNLFGSITLLFTLLGIILLAYVAMSKYGSIRLGKQSPEFSTFSWIAMMISCGLGSATVYWAFIEWAYYINTPGIGIDPGSQLAYEMSVPYSMFHWGISAWTLYALVGLPIAYHFYVKKNKGLSLSAVVSSMTNIKANGYIGRLIDVMFIFICFGGLSITLGVSVPLVAEVLATVIGIKPTFTLNLAIILVLSAIYSLSSYIGIQRGMRNLADFNAKLVIVFTVGVLVLGPTIYIMKNTTSSLGLMFQNFIQMSLYTDPVGNGGFPESWTMFYWLYWITYAPFTGIFIAKVSRGRTLRSVIANTLLSGSAGCFIFFGVLGSLSMQRQLAGSVDMVGMLSAGQDNAAIVQVLHSLPFGSIFMILFSIITLLFLATTLDGAAFTMASTSTIGLKNNEEPNPFLRLFWCIMLSLVPLTMILINANLDTIKTSAVATGVPVIFIMIVMLIGWMKWMFNDYGHYSTSKIEEESFIKE
ncbi:BCCT family betaine/carnitine transporter [Desulfitispora alkaliphila]|uniref:BCCT family transporter n=1 Tax=Desulfitispora alkaliphila TaxID=622674 RepID=UPI003D225B48